jgi:glycosyltransferase involved in cell wall biosynthesis
MSPYIPPIRLHSKAVIVLRAHNVEHQLWGRRTAETRNPLKRAVLLRLTAQLRHDEENACELVDGIAAISEQDAAVFRQLTENRIPITHLPYALPLPELNPRIKTQPFTLGHLGAMDWEPTVEGVRWLVHEVWPLVVQQEPSARLLLAGRHLRKSDPLWAGQGIEVVGEVDNAFDFLQSVAVTAVPPHSGGGIRIKLAEALAMGRPVVSTTVGAEGLPVKSGTHLILADDPKAFANWVVHFFRSPDTANGRGQRGRQLIADLFDRKQETKKLLDFYTQLRSIEVS